MKKIEQILFFLTLLFFPTQLGKHFWPQFSFVYSLPIDYLAPIIYFWDLLVVLLIIIFLLQKKYVNRIALNIFLIFILTQGVSVQLGGGIVRLEQYFIIGLFGVYLASQNFEELIKKIFWPLLISTIFISVLAILQFIKETDLGFWILGERNFSLSAPAIAKFDFKGVQFLRPYATFPHPNTLAAYLVIVPVILSLSQDLRSRNKFGMTMNILAGLALILTASRIALFAAAVELVFFLKSRGLLILLFLLLFLSPFLVTRYISLIDFDNLSFSRREQLSRIGINLVSQNYLTGVGLNNFIPVTSEQLLVGQSRFLQPIHNIFLLTLAETGLIGLIGLIFLMGFPILKLFRLYPTHYSLSPLLLLWMVVIFLGMFDHYFLTQPQGLRVLFLLWGLSLSTVSSRIK